MSALSPPASDPPVAPAPAPPPAPSAAAAPADDSLRSLLGIGRSLALLFALLAGLLFLVFLAFALLDVLLGYGAGDLVAAVYCLVSAVVNFVIWRELPALEKLAGDGQYAALRERLLVWAVLGIVFFFVVGVVLLVAWIKVESRGSSPAPS